MPFLLCSFGCFAGEHHGTCFWCKLCLVLEVTLKALLIGVPRAMADRSPGGSSGQPQTTPRLESGAQIPGWIFLFFRDANCRERSTIALVGTIPRESTKEEGADFFSR